MRNVRRQEATVPKTGRSIVGTWVVACTTVPPTRSARPEPMKIPIEYTLIARPRCLFGNESAIIENAPGASVASPTPTPMRARNSDQKLFAPAHDVVITDQTSTPTEMSRRRFPLSAMRPIGNPSVVYRSANARPCNTDTRASLMPRSRLMGATSRLRIWRSTNASV
jgi:hypothetical protein